MNSHKPDTTPQDSLHVANQIDVVCDEFESSWVQGKRPRIADFLKTLAPQAQPTLLVELIRLDASYRRLGGETPSTDEYLTEFSDYGVLLTDVDLEVAPLDDNYRLESGDRINQFELQQQVGQGSFGAVWRAYDTRLHRSVALKTPLPNRVNRDQLHPFLREARAAAKLLHPNIIRVHEVIQSSTSTCIVSEFIDGHDLGQWLADHRPPFQQSAQLCVQLARALQYAHEQGVIHRDVKPGNVLIDADGETHLTDFGLAKHAFDATLSTVIDDGNLLGTPAYMSPEQAAGRADSVDHRTDIYSLGVMFYQLLTNQLPFAGKQAAVIHQVQNVEPVHPRTLNKSIPPDCETICLKAMQKDPRWRYQTAGEFADDLDRFLAGKPVHARPIGQLQQAWRWAGRNRAIAVLSGVCMAATCALLLVLLIPDRDIDSGQQHVSITTVPAGAKIAFVPLDEFTHEPRQPIEIIHSRGPSPLVQTLDSGDYLVVAYLQDGRFHEVYRHVPTLAEVGAVRTGRSLTLGYRHASFSPMDDGRIKLPIIYIPQANVSDGMALIDGSPNFRLGSKDDPLHKSHRRNIPSFHIATHEFTHADYKNFESVDGITYGRTIDIIERLNLPDSAPLRVNWSTAMTLAERRGKRLPTEAEYQYAATGGGKHRFPWGDDLPKAAEEITRFGLAEEPAFDCLVLPGQPNIYGLCSNVAEWTSSYSTLPHANGFAPVVRGGSLQVIGGDPRVTQKNRDPRHRESIQFDETKPGLGFRMVRSAKPRLKPEDFEIVLPER